ncbi:hypothetical protein ILYODFUR_003373 [Ilyodon furcidens]|uniref:Uncharacterized protein n=1 Tax=Ilyodon furcidens TaxID=33524 RepID=A0ABV0TUH0_9TELE
MPQGSLPFLCDPPKAADPVWHVTAPLASLEHILHPQSGAGQLQLAALSLIDLAPMLTQTPGGHRGGGGKKGSQLTHLQVQWGRYSDAVATQNTADGWPLCACLTGTRCVSSEDEGPADKHYWRTSAACHNTG